MKKSKFIVGTLASLALSTMAVSASATDFLFSFAGTGGMNGTTSGTLHATSNGGGTYTATSGTITTFGPVSTGSGTLIVNPSAPGAQNSPSGFFTYDDQLAPGQNPLLTNPGLLFSIGGDEVNIYSNGTDYTLYNNSGAFATGAFALSQVAAVPEPATWALMLLGFGMVGGGLRARKRQNVRVTYA